MSLSVKLLLLLLVSVKCGIDVIQSFVFYAFTVVIIKVGELRIDLFI